MQLHRLTDTFKGGLKGFSHLDLGLIRPVGINPMGNGKFIFIGLSLDLTGNITAEPTNWYLVLVDPKLTWLNTDGLFDTIPPFSGLSKSDSLSKNWRQSLTTYLGFQESRILA